MQVSVDWLKEYASVKAGTTAIAERLTMTLNEVDQIRSVTGLQDIVVGEIAEITPHPNADKLRVTIVKTNGSKRRKIVCGADNIEVGQRVPVALPGTTLPDGLEIERRDIRGVTSDGMLCSPRELGVGEDQGGIWILPGDSRVGAKLPSALGRSHDGFELEVLANRPDCLGHLGIAREVAAAYGVKLREPRLKTTERLRRDPYQVKRGTGCDRYRLAYLTGLRNRHSPQWLKRRLLAVGLRPVNAIVDVTNFVMLEYGQPLHAMDAGKIAGTSISVRPARANERVITLDGVERTAPSGALLIADREKALGFAGIMGAANSEIEPKTTEVVLECAHFDRARTRRTSRALGLSTDASIRFERGLPQALTRPAMLRAVDLLLELCGGTLEQLTDSGAKPRDPKPIRLDLDTASEFLGIEIPSAAARRILTALGFGLTGTARKLAVRPPEWRTDVHGPEDLYEELIRLYGYDKLPETLPGGSAGAAVRPATFKLDDRIRDRLVGSGFTEILTHSLVGDDLLERSGFPAALTEIANPLSADHRYLRGSLGPRHLEAIQSNLRWRDRLRLFEIGRVFEATKPGERPNEQRKLMVSVAAKKGAETFADVRGALTVLFEHLRVAPDAVRFKSVTLGKFVPGRHFQVWVGRAKIGWIADFRFPDRFKAKSVSMLSLNLDRLAGVIPTEPSVTMPASHPPVYRDLSVYLPTTASYAELRRVVLGNGKPYLAAVSDPEEYFHDGKRSLTLALEFRAQGRTLTDGEVNATMANIEAALKSHGWETRG